MAAKSAQPAKYRKAKDVKLGDTILMHPADSYSSWELRQVAHLEISGGRPSVYHFTAADGWGYGGTGGQYMEGQYPTV